MNEKMLSSKVAGSGIVGILVLLILQTVLPYVKPSEANGAAMATAANKQAAEEVVIKAIQPLRDDINGVNAAATARQMQILEANRALVAELRAQSDLTKELILLVRDLRADERRRNP